jgi:signal transduction histidine kinase
MMDSSDEKVSILLVDDKPQNLVTLEAVLGELGQNMVVAHTGKEALREVLAHDFAVILMDVHMPEMDGYEAAELIRNRPANQYTPIIFLTASSATDVQMFQGYSVGAVDYLFKPVNATILRSKVSVFVDLAKKAALIKRQAEELFRREVEVQKLAELKKIDEQLIISDRMISMGTLAAGVAHEINNPLASVMANLDLAARDVIKRIGNLGLSSELSELKEELDDACKATEQIRDIVSDLKIFSRSRAEKVHAVNIQQVMESTLRMARNEIRHRAHLVTHYGKTPPVQANESLLGQVFLNLVINAVQAMPDGDSDHNEIRISTGMDTNGDVLIEVADTGSGMPPEVLAQMFIPFFTTKPIGVGTGLGLAICHHIITSLEGTIKVKSSAVGVGTSFQIRLPTAHTENLKDAPPPVPALSARRRGKILVIDDESMILKAVFRVLSPQHEVITMEEGQKAFEQINAGERFDVILCDLMMPQMTGMELYDKISEVAQEQASRIIFFTGGAFTPMARDFLKKTPNLCIEKPFEIASLEKLINERIQ